MTYPAGLGGGLLKHGITPVDMSASLNYNYTLAASATQTINFDAVTGAYRVLVCAIGTTGEALGIQFDKSTGEYFKLIANFPFEIPCAVRNYIYLKNFGSHSMDVSIMIVRDKK